MKQKIIDDFNNRSYESALKTLCDAESNSIIRDICNTMLAICDRTTYGSGSEQPTEEDHTTFQNGLAALQRLLDFNIDADTVNTETNSETENITLWMLIDDFNKQSKDFKYNIILKQDGICYGLYSIPTNQVIATLHPSSYPETLSEKEIANFYDRTNNSITQYLMSFTEENYDNFMKDPEYIKNAIINHSNIMLIDDDAGLAIQKYMGDDSLITMNLLDIHGALMFDMTPDDYPFQQNCIMSPFSSHVCELCDINPTEIFQQVHKRLMTENPVKVATLHETKQIPEELKEILQNYTKDHGKIFVVSTTSESKYDSNVLLYDKLLTILAEQFHATKLYIQILYHNCLLVTAVTNDEDNSYSNMIVAHTTALGYLSHYEEIPVSESLYEYRAENKQLGVHRLDKIMEDVIRIIGYPLDEF